MRVRRDFQREWESKCCHIYSSSSRRLSCNKRKSSGTCLKPFDRASRNIFSIGRSKRRTSSRESQKTSLSSWYAMWFHEIYGLILFLCLDEPNMRKVDFKMQVSDMKAEYFPPKVDIILQNEIPTDFYILVSGAVVWNSLTWYKYTQIMRC